MTTSEHWRVKVTYPNGSERFLGRDEDGWHTTGPLNKSVFRFASRETAERAIEESMQALWEREHPDLLATYQIIRVVEQEPVYEGPRPTAWEKLLGDDNV